MAMRPDKRLKRCGDCFVAPLLAMTGNGYDGSGEGYLSCERTRCLDYDNDNDGDDAHVHE